MVVAGRSHRSSSSVGRRSSSEIIVVRSLSSSSASCVVVGSRSSAAVVPCRIVESESMLADSDRHRSSSDQNWVNCCHLRPCPNIGRTRSKSSTFGYAPTYGANAAKIGHASESESGFRCGCEFGCGCACLSVGEALHALGILCLCSCIRVCKDTW